ncbi:MAG: hemerythrin domain-containing protein [Bacteroidetes bacterium]|nr:hemerythrin domain-containing protein [Bacteroidota bacterium]
MKAVEIMMDEHRVIEKALKSLEKAANKIEAGEDVRTEFFLEAAEFIQEYADGCHHSKEENIFFGIMLSSGYSKDEDPLKTMYTEHNMGRHFIRGMKMATEEVIAGDKTRNKNISANAKNYVVLLRFHIKREDNEVFPDAINDLSDETISDIEKAFEEEYNKELENGLHTKYAALAEKLEKEME